jgi:hypothetical protein
MPLDVRSHQSQAAMPTDDAIMRRISTLRFPARPRHARETFKVRLPGARSCTTDSRIVTTRNLFPDRGCHYEILPMLCSSHLPRSDIPAWTAATLAVPYSRGDRVTVLGTDRSELQPQRQANKGKPTCQTKQYIAMHCLCLRPLLTLLPKPDGHQLASLMLRMIAQNSTIDTPHIPPSHGFEAPNRIAAFWLDETPAARKLDRRLATCSLSGGPYPYFQTRL